MHLFIPFNALFFYPFMHQLLASESSTKLLEHSPKHPENPSETFAETSQKSSEVSPESSPKLPEHSPKFTNSSPESCVRHYTVYTFQYFKLRNYLLKFRLYNINPTNSARLQGTPCKLTLYPTQGHRSCPTNSAILQGTPTASLRSYPFQGHRSCPPSYTLPT